jgi:Protein of unknown function (DUF3349)
MGWRGGLSSIIAFLRAGYPGGAPPAGYAPLLALLPRRISEDEVAAIARTLIVHKRGPIENVDVGLEITRITCQMPSLDDIDRVRDRLDAFGWAGGDQAG